MRIRYHYIYVPGPVVYVRRQGMSPAAARAALAELLGKLAALESKTSPENRATLKKLHELIVRMNHLMGEVPSAKLRAVLVAAMGAALQAAQSDDMNGAVNQMADAVGLAGQIVDKGNMVKGSMASLSSIGGSLAGAGQRAVNGAIAAASQALGDASSVDDLNDVLSFVQGAVADAEQLQAATPGSAEYNFYLSKLETATNTLKSQFKGTNAAPTEGVAMSEDALALSDASRRYADHVHALADKTSDHFERQKLGGLERDLTAVGEQLKQLPGDAAQKAALQALNAIMAQVGERDLDGARRATGQLLARMQQLGALDKVVAAKFDRAEQIAARLNGPAAAALRGVLQAAQAARENVTTPEALEALDRQLMGAMLRAERLGTLTPDQARQAPALRELLTLTQRLQPRPAGSGRLGGDRLKLTGSSDPTRRETGVLGASRGTGRLNESGPFRPIIDEAADHGSDNAIAAAARRIVPAVDADRLDTSSARPAPAAAGPTSPSASPGIPGPGASTPASPSGPKAAAPAPEGPPRTASGEIDFEAIYRSAPMERPPV